VLRAGDHRIFHAVLVGERRAASRSNLPTDRYARGVVPRAQNGPQQVVFEITHIKLHLSFPGLWQVCFKNFEEPHHWYDTKFTGCWWVFEEEYYIIHDFLLPGLKNCVNDLELVELKNYIAGFFVATQTLFTFCFTLLLICLLSLVRYIFTDDDDPNMSKLLFIVSGFSGSSGLL
jgi:hypothetical protein